MEEQNQQNKKGIPKGLKIAAIIAGAVIIYYIASIVYAYIKIQRGDVVKWGGVWYTKEELAQKFPPQYYEAEAKNTPEEVYATFRQALLDSNLELALEQMTEKHKEGYREAFQDKAKFDEWVKRLPEKIIDGEKLSDNVTTSIKIDGNRAYYDWNKDNESFHIILFVKDLNGYWKVDNI